MILLIVAVLMMIPVIIRIVQYNEKRQPCYDIGLGGRQGRGSDDNAVSIFGFTYHALSASMIFLIILCKFI